MKWIKSESTIMPETVDATSSKTTVYLRRGINEKQCTNEMNGNKMTYYEYEETTLTHKEYDDYLQVAEMLNMRQIRADVDYIALCTDINLEV